MAAGFDHSVLLQGMQQGPSAFETMRTLQDMVQRRQQHESTLGALLQKQTQEQALRDIYKTHGADPNVLMSAGFGPEAYEAQKHTADIATRNAQVRKSDIDAMQERARFLAQPLYGLRDQAGLDNAFAFWRQSGASEEDLAWLPKQYNEQTAPFFQQLAATAVPAEKRAEMAHETQKTKDQRTWQEGRDRQSQAAARERALIIAGQKAEERQGKDATEAATKKRKAYLEGFSLNPDAEPTDKELSDIRSVQANTWTIADNVKEMRDIYKAHGNSPLPGPVRARLSQLATELKMAAKGPEMYALGVIAGPDEAILDRVIEDPTTANATFLDFVGNDQSLTKLEGFSTLADRRFKNKARSLGFRGGGGKAPAGATKPPKDKTPGAPANLTPEQRRARMAEIEAELAADEGEQ